MKIETNLDYNSILAGEAEVVHLAVSLKAEPQEGGRANPFAFTLVLDNSGSMAGAPLDHAKQAATMVVRNLRAEDQFALVVFSNTARTVVPLQPATDKARIERLIAAIGDEGTTNLTAGWMLGCDELRAAPEGFPRKLLLLSDGHLNTGIVESQQIRGIVASGLEKDAVRTSCLGFSDGYNEDLLEAMAGAAGGALHDADSPEAFPAIFGQELGSLLKLSAQNVRVRIKRLHYCSGVGLLCSYPVVELPAGGIEIAVGDLVSEEERVLVLALEVLPLPRLADNQPAASLEGEALLELEILYDELQPNGVASRRETHTVRVSPAQSAADVQANEKVVEWVALQTAGKAINEAIADRDRDDEDALRRRIAEAISRLQKYNCPQSVQAAVQTLTDFLASSENWDARTRKSSRLYASRSTKSSSYFGSDPNFILRANADANRASRGQPKPPPAQPGTPGSSSPTPPDQSGSGQPGPA